MTLHVKFDEARKFSILGGGWSARLGLWDKVPKGHLLLDAELEDDGKQIPVQLFCVLDSENTLRHDGQWQLAP